MNLNRNDKILKMIRTQAVMRAELHRREESSRQDLRLTLEALQELTGLPRPELEAIAANVTAAYEPQERDFFSVKNQFLMVFSGLAVIGFFVWIFIR